MQLHNTLSGRKEDFVPLDPQRVTMYVCGPTVYSYAHIGNARPAVVFDVLARLLLRRSFRDVTNNLKLMRADVVRGLRLEEPGFAVNAETGLQPLVMGKAVALHPVAVILSVAAGSYLAGIPGALFAVPLAAFVNVVAVYLGANVAYLRALGLVGLVLLQLVEVVVREDRDRAERDLLALHARQAQFQQGCGHAGPVAAQQTLQIELN